MVEAIHIQVTQDHIDKGWKNSTFKCPTALALREYYPNATVELFTYRLQRFNNNQPLMGAYAHSQEVIDWIADFDNDNGVEPFVFVIQPHVVEIEGVGNVI